MSVFPQFDANKQPSYKIELHVHLDGAVRLTTIWELAQKKGIDLKCKSLDELIKKCKIGRPSTLENFLAPFKLVLPCIFGDLDAIERISYEICEDLSSQNVLYAEVRYCPHLFCQSLERSGDGSQVTPKEVVQSIIKGLKQGQDDFKLKVRSILCCFRGKPEWSAEILSLCKEFASEGVVGLDIAGDEAKVMASKEDIRVFQEAARLKIHRTAHAAEAGPASNAALAKNELLAERIGHGYHILEDEQLYKSFLDAKIHFETCPYSSLMTGSVPLNTAKHPIIRFAEDNANFSISRDDPFIIQKTIEEEYSLLKQLGMTNVHIARANFNAARSCFLPDCEKQELISALNRIYGVNE